MMQSMLDTLSGYLAQGTDAHGDPSFALIPQRLPTVSFFQREYAEFMLNFTDEHGQRVSRHYNGQGQRLGLDGSIESTFAEDFINEVMGQNAIVPKWEADTIRQRMDHGDPDAWKDETLPTPDDVKGGLMALTFHLPGAPSPSFPLPEGPHPLPSPEGRGEVGENPYSGRGEPGALRARFDLSGDGYLDAVDWTQPYQAFLALDRDGNGIIDSGSELLTTHASASHRRYAPGRAKRWRVVRGRRAVRGGFRHAPAHAVEPLWASAVPRRGALDRRAAEAGRVPRDPEHCAETVGARGTGKSRRAYRGPAHTGPRASNGSTRTTTAS
jgi:hypothetical protein